MNRGEVQGGVEHEVQLAVVRAGGERQAGARGNRPGDAVHHTASRRESRARVKAGRGVRAPVEDTLLQSHIST